MMARSDNAREGPPAIPEQTCHPFRKLVESGRFGPECPAAFSRNQWQVYAGTGGNFRPEFSQSYSRFRATMMKERKTHGGRKLQTGRAYAQGSSFARPWDLSSTVSRVVPDSRTLRGGRQSRLSNTAFAERTRGCSLCPIGVYCSTANTRADPSMGATNRCILPNGPMTICTNGTRSSLFRATVVSKASISRSTSSAVL